MKKTILTLKRHQCHIHFYLIAAVLPLFFLSGCKGEKITPCGCEDVIYWASDTCSFSFSEYNSTKQVRDYFSLHDSTVVKHSGDTVKFWGWVYYPNHDEPFIPEIPDQREPNYRPDAEKIVLATHKDYPGYSRQSELLDVNWRYSSFTKENPWFNEEFDSLLNKKWYVTAIVVASRIYFPGCYSYYPEFNMIALDTVPNNN